MSEFLQWVPLSKIRIHPRARQHDPAKLEELQESLKSIGQQQPGRGRYIPDSNGFIELYIGQGRYLAVKALNWEAIQVIVKEASNEEVDLAMLHENIKREELDPVQEAAEYKYLMDTYKWSQAQVAGKVGMRQQSISELLSILTLPQDVQDLTARAVINKKHCVLIAKLQDDRDQSKIAKKVAKEGWSVRELEKQVNKVLGKPSPKQGEGENEMTDPLAAYWAELGWKVHYKGGSRWELEVDLGSGVAEQDLRKAMRDRLSALADTLKFKPQEQQKN